MEENGSYLSRIIRNISVVSYISVQTWLRICDVEGWRPLSPFHASFFMSHLTDGGGGRGGHEKEDKERRRKRKDEKRGSIREDERGGGVQGERNDAQASKKLGADWPLRSTMPDGWRGSLQLSSSSTKPSLVLFGFVCTVAFHRRFPIKLQPTPLLLPLSCTMRPLSPSLLFPLTVCALLYQPQHTRSEFARTRGPDGNGGSAVRVRKRAHCRAVG